MEIDNAMASLMDVMEEFERVNPRVTKKGSYTYKYIIGGNEVELPEDTESP